MNKVILIGNLTRDPELSTTNGGVSVCRFSLAVTRRFANADGEREADFLNIVVWRAQAENCAKLLWEESKLQVTRHRMAVSVTPPISLLMKWNSSLPARVVAMEIMLQLSQKENKTQSKPLNFKRLRTTVCHSKIF